MNWKITIHTYAVVNIYADVCTVITVSIWEKKITLNVFKFFIASKE